MDLPSLFLIVPTLVCSAIWNYLLAENAIYEEDEPVMAAPVLGEDLPDIEAEQPQGRMATNQRLLRLYNF